MFWKFWAGLIGAALIVLVLNWAFTETVGLLSSW